MKNKHITRSTALMGLVVGLSLTTAWAQEQGQSFQVMEVKNFLVQAEGGEVDFDGQTRETGAIAFEQIGVGHAAIELDREPTGQLPQGRLRINLEGELKSPLLEELEEGAFTGTMQLDIPWQQTDNGQIIAGGSDINVSFWDIAHTHHIWWHFWHFWIIDPWVWVDFAEAGIGMEFEWNVLTDDTATPQVEVIDLNWEDLGGGVSKHVGGQGQMLMDVVEPVLGDLSIDGQLNNGDIQGFIDAALQGDEASPLEIALADFDADGRISNQDIAPFVDALLGAGVSAEELQALAAIPEPASAVILTIGSLLLGRRRNP